MLASLGADADDDAVSRFVVAENLVWRPRHELEPTVLDLLDALRERGLMVGLVSNLFDPPQLMRELFAEIGLLERLDAIAVSAEVGKRKPSRVDLRGGARPGGGRGGGGGDGRRPLARGRRRGAGGRAGGDPGVLVRGRRVGRASSPMRARRSLPMCCASSAQPENRLFVKSCGDRTAAVTIPGMTDSLAPTTPTELPLRPQDEVECRRCEVHCDKVVYPSSCVERSCPFVYAYEAFGHTYMGCMQRVFDVEIDLDLLRAASRRRDGFGAVVARKAPLPMCHSEVEPCYELRSRRGGLPQSGVLRAAGREPELPGLRAARRLVAAARGSAATQLTREILKGALRAPG